MKKVFKSLRRILAIISAVVLTFLIVFYIVFLNIKSLASKKGITDVASSIDIVTILQDPKMGTTWDSVTNLGNEIGINEDQMTEILGNDEIKTKVADYVGTTLSKINTDGKIDTKDSSELVDAIVEQYNNISNKKITDEKKAILTNYVDTKVTNVINEKLGTNNILSNVNNKYNKITNLANKILFGNYDFIILVMIVIFIFIIALLEFSYYRWIPYVATSSIISCLMLLAGNILISKITIDSSMSLLFNSIKDIIISNIYNDIIILLIIGIILTIIYFVIKYLIKKNQEKTA